MDKNTRFDVERLRAIPIPQVVERWGSRLKKVGSRWVTNCPWHADEHPSLTLYETDGENRCYCFACGRGGSVIDYVMAKDGVDFRGACELLNKEFLGGGGEAAATAVPKRRAVPVERRARAERKVAYVPTAWLAERVSVENSLSRCLLQLFDRHLVEHLTEEYRLGCYDNGHYADCVLFPSIDQEGRVHNVKVQRYDTDPASPRFAHSDKRCCYWLGPTLQREGVVPSDAVLDNCCLFGEHLLDRYPSQTVALVESPKNALFGAAVQPHYVWVATGNKGMLKRELMEPLRGRRVLVFPDRDAIGEWRNILNGMDDVADFSVSDFCERYAPKDDLKFDVADYVLIHNSSYQISHSFSMGGSS